MTSYRGGQKLIFYEAIGQNILKGEQQDDTKYCSFSSKYCLTESLVSACGATNWPFIYV